MVLQRKVRAAIGKNAVVHKKALLYYCCYFNIKLLRTTYQPPGGKPGRVVNT